MNTIFILIGPKGSGKSYIGKLLERELGIKFLAIEDIFKELQSAGVSRPDIQEKGYKIVEEKVSKILEQETEVSFEITVLTPISEDLLNRLRLSAKIELVQVYAPMEKCLERIKARNQKKQIEISEEEILVINKLSMKQQINSRIRLNTSEMSDGAILKKFKEIYSKYC